MTQRRHEYRVEVTWTGNLAGGTRGAAGYSRAHEISAAGKPGIAGSSDPAFRGDAARWNPEELLVASVSACHQLWYLGLCAEAGVVVTGYEDVAEGVMVEEAGGAGQFAEIILRPRVTLAAGADAALALALHEQAHGMCFIARSVAFAVRCEAVVGFGG